MKTLGYVFNAVTAFTIVCLVMSVATRVMESRQSAPASLPHAIPTPALGR